MMFQADAAFALELIALGVGFWVLLKTRNNEAGNLKGFGTFIGYFIIVVAFLALLCTGYYTVRYWEDGYFTRTNTAQMAMMQRMYKMQNCDHDMMKKDRCEKMMSAGKKDMNCEKMMKGEKMKGGMMKGKMGGMQDKAEHHPDKDNQ
ncbi:MAG: DUF4199 domain-containing protein [FCB group bacterium]|nr:DUF4199 domain-containing protein [FCB group bacterium]